jgi:uncharacterized protein (DUF2126 family)/transglutaminase-like putative cysteine protease
MPPEWLMPVQVALTHRTQYRFERPVTLGPHFVRLRPAPHGRAPISAYALHVTPTHYISWQQDPFGNFLARIVLAEKSTEFAVTVDLIAEMSPINPFDFFVEEGAERFPLTYEPALASDLRPYLDQPPSEPLLDRYLAGIDRSPRSTVQFISDLNVSLSRHIDYRTRMEAGFQTAEETLQTQSGSCRDTGWLLVQILRRLGFAARFVSGYLIQLTPDQAGSGTAARGDTADLHAWAEVYIPGAGWIGLDPTSGLFAGEGHIPLAATPSPLTAAPITGTHEPARVDFSFSMQVARICETPRTSKPYSDAQWQAILSAGDRVEERLSAGDVRLTMGGEPTFVAAEDSMAPEWNIAALGPTKHIYADKLAHRLRQRFAKGGMLHHGLGKWYPGEQVARWAYALYWRKDGQPLWRADDLIAGEATRPAATSAALSFAAALCHHLGLAGNSAIPAYEDPAHAMLIEQKLPLGIKLEDAQLAEPAERDRLMRTFERGLDRPVGYVLPLLVSRTLGEERRWTTERWAFRRGNLFLIPGASPVGLRLPLTGLQEIDYIDYPHVLPLDPFAPRQSLLSTEERDCSTHNPQVGPAQPIDPSAPVRTALALEVRDGHLHVFLPPLADGEDYAALLAAIEKAATDTGQPIRLEGYEPPFDPRVAFIKVTPDPGVIEVNVHPAASWRDSIEITTAIYDEAHQIGLTAEKFMIDGRQTGTGGGNHVVLGGTTPADSPLLRRPDLLASIIRYWQNHPSLSYLFSGLFVGPTSQAPRIDEARHDSLYELEIALRRIPEAGQVVSPWLIDRLLRNLLVDVTGNTHRAEICIDKLYSPDGPMGRLGLVEFRAFEMPPHPRMSLAQQLLIRALVAWFWDHPYRQPLVRWGTALHDRFMLPHFLWADLENVVADLRSADLPMQSEWFAPHLAFRCPVIGRVQHAGIELELRHALEPWLVLGEQSDSGSTARTVDSSLERLQVKVAGTTGDRFTVACNGYTLPLTNTATSGEAIAGVRYRTFQPPHGFHPTIGPHVPLTFDIYDTWTGRSIGGCRYHATHPAGRSYAERPVNALEAEARRTARFDTMGHTPGASAPKATAAHPDFPMTLDLRAKS